MLEGKGVEFDPHIVSGPAELNYWNWKKQCFVFSDSSGYLVVKVKTIRK